MKKKVSFSDHNDIKIQHVLPDQFAQAIGPFVLLDHITSYKRSPGKQYKEVIEKSQLPHRGVAILTYIISGEVEHIDSMGNHVKLGPGGIHWMKTGKGIIHDEIVNPECEITRPDVSVTRFWINLPSKYKHEQPDYFAFSLSNIPKQILADEAGWLKILCGSYNNTEAKIPCYSKQFLYHIHLEEGKKFSIAIDKQLEYAAFLLTNKIVINNKEFLAGEFLQLNSHGEMIEINSNRETAADIILFGGEPYNEPIIMEETFVMNNPHEITQAYNDYYNGKYGDIPFDKYKPL